MNTKQINQHNNCNYPYILIKLMAKKIKNKLKNKYIFLKKKSNG